MTDDATTPTPALAPSKIVLLNRNNLRIADLCPKAESRYTLNAIQVTREETVTTNGHYLVRVSLPKGDAANGNNFPSIEGWPKESGEWVSVLLPQATAKEVFKNIPRKSTIPILANAAIYKREDGRVSVGTTDLDQSRLVDGKMTGQFPNWQRVLDTKPHSCEITLNPDYVSKLAKQCAEFIGDSQSQPTMRIRIVDGNTMVRFDARNSETGQEWTAALMPMRDSTFTNSYEPVAVPDPFADVPEFAHVDAEPADAESVLAVTSET